MYLCAWVFYLYVCIFIVHVYCIIWGQKIVPGPLELKLLMSVRNHMGAGHCQNIFSAPIDF